MKYAFYPGCSLESTAWEYDKSTRAVCQALDIELVEIPDWTCCGSTPAHCTSHSLAVALPVLNLQKAKTMGLPVLTACASCYARLRTANYAVAHDKKERKRAKELTGNAYNGSVQVRHVLDILLNDAGIELIRQRVKQPLTGLKVACYYGCLLSRPPKVVAFDDPEHPMGMDRLIEAIGAEPVEWPYKTECCGAGLSLTNTDVVCRLGHRLLSMAREAGADCVTVACPMCQVNLDLRQEEAVEQHGKLPETPIPYVTQLLGLALGLRPEEVGLEALIVEPTLLLKHRSEATSDKECRHGAE